MRALSAALGLSCSRRGCFHGLHCSGSGLLCRELSEAGPGLPALSRSKPLRFRFSGTPQRRRLSWVCVLCPSQVQAAQVTRCLASIVTSSWGVCLIASPVPATWFSGCTMGTARVQPWWIREIRIGNGVGEEKTYLFINIRLD